MLTYLLFCIVTAKYIRQTANVGGSISVSVSVSGAVMVSDILMVLLTVKVLYEICQMGSSGLCGPLAVTVSILDTPHWSFQHRSTR